MICPNCMVQMHQKPLPTLPGLTVQFAGGGTSDDSEYTTWTIQICPDCGREVKEFYSATVVKEGK